MLLPPELVEAMRQAGGSQPLTSARALYDLHGNLGDAYVAADKRALWIFSQAIGQTRAFKTFKWTELNEVAVRVEQVFAFLTLRTATQEFTLKFSSWDKPHLDEIANLWQTAGGRTAPAIPAPRPPAEKPPVPQAPKQPAQSAPPALSPLALFCAAIQAMIECDDHIDMLELNLLSRKVTDAGALGEGYAFLKEQGMEAVAKAAEARLNSKQKLCLFANLIGVAMADGLLRSEEMALLDKFQEVLAISAADRQWLYDGLLIQHGLAVFAEPGATGPLSSLVAFCAAMHAMMTGDANLGADEQEFLSLLVPDAAVIQAGIDYVNAHGLERLLAELPVVLSNEQQLCLMSNLIALAMADGMIRPDEQKLLDRFRSALGISEAEYTAVFELLILKNNLGVFAG